MAGILKVDTIQNANADNIITQTNSTTLTIGTSGDTVILAAGATSSGFGATYNGAVNWDTTKKTTGFTAVSGVGYFCDTTSSAFTVTLPSSPSAGAIVAISDYANTFATNNITVGRNGSNIAGTASNSVLSTSGVSVTFVYVDATQGWIVTDSGNRSDLPQPTFITATGGTVTCCGNYKIHTFTGPGTFTVSSVGNPLGSTTVDYLVVAGGGGGGSAGTGGGGAGGYRESKATGAPWTASPLATSTSLPVSVQGYPITVGGGGAGNPFPSSPLVGTSGSNSIFSTITSTGGGGGGQPGGNSGGSGGGGPTGNGGAGNTPPVSPPQGQSGGGSDCGAGGGGAGEAGNTDGNRYGGDGVSTSISGSPTFYAGGGGGGYGGGFPPIPGGDGGGGASGNSVPGVPGAGTTPGVAGTTNTGGGGGGGGYGCGRAGGAPQGSGGTGGSGIVVIRYKFQ